MARSYNDSNTNGGVAYANANNDASNTNSNYGSRLIFRKENIILWLLAGTCPKSNP
nr:MAG TPA: hypothetical protein [Caudoviricetes sp.]